MKITQRHFIAVLPVLWACAWGFASAQTARVEFTVNDTMGTPTPCRIHLWGVDGKPVRPPGLPFHFDHFSCAGSASVDIPPGACRYEIERGPEFSQASGAFSAVVGVPQKISASLERRTNLAKEGWYGGDMHVHRPPGDIELLMKAEDLHIAPVITWWNKRSLWAEQKRPDQLLVNFDRNRYYHLMGGEDEREGGALLYFDLNDPLPIGLAAREYPSPMKFLAMARERKGAWVDIEKPFWWDVPVWVASGQVDSIGLANNHMCRAQMYENEAWGKPRDVQRLPAPRGNGFWTQEIYYQLLNCGLRLPPSAGSAIGVLANPVGYNRVWVQCGDELTWEKWWEGLRAGHSFVSNGPLLRVKANGQWPGHVFTSAESIEIEVEAALDGRDVTPVLEIIRNGRVERSVPIEEWHKNNGKLGSLKFSESGWFLVRVIADNPKTFRFATTAPYYVEVGAVKQRVSRGSAQFFLDWVRERMARVNLPDAAQREEVLSFHRDAEKFWQEKVAGANAE